MKVINTLELKHLLKGTPVIFDVRDTVSYSQSHISNAKHLDFDEINEAIGSLDKDLPIVIYCYHGVSSLRVAQLIEGLGFSEVYSLQGGYSQWLNDL